MPMNMNSHPESLIEYLTVLKNNGVPEADFEKHIGRFLELSARRKDIPLYGTFELTPFCNLDCKMCYVHLNESQFSPKNLLSTSTWLNIIDESYKNGMRRASLTGGECLTYPGFNDIYLFLYDKGIKPGILSNGVLMDNKRIDFFLKYQPRNIQISIYGSNEQAYERVTGKRLFSVVLRNVKAIHEAGLPIKISITPSEFMQDDIEKLIDCVNDLGIQYNINSFLSVPRENTGRKKRDMTVDYYISAYRRADKLKHIHEKEEVDLSELPDVNQNGNIQKGILCGAGRSSFVINHDGSMSPCASLNHIKAYPLLSSFIEAWHLINDAVKSYILPAECNECIYSEVCLKCVARHIYAPVPGHCDPTVCERTKHMISAGILPIPQKIRGISSKEKGNE